jgi:outer membrane protein assembly factor BamB
MSIYFFRRLYTTVVLVLFSTLICAEDMPLTDCSARGGVTPFCGFKRPEDIEPIANGARLLLSEYGSLAGTREGRLVIFDPDTTSRTVIYPLSTSGGETPVAGWGDDKCPGPPGPGFSPHGIHVSDLGGANRVLVVNHTGREAVEFFEVLNADQPLKLGLAWRGCVIAPDNIWMNDVASIGDNAFVASHMVTRAAGEEALFAAEAQQSDTGWVMSWSTAAGWNKVEGSDGGLPNGVEVSPAGDIVYINEYFGDKVTAVEIASGKRLWSAVVTGPDNSSWSSDGLLLVASHQQDLKHVLECNEHIDTVCNLRYKIVAIRVQDGATVDLFSGGGGDPMGGVTVATEHDGNLYFGSFAGDRMARIKRPATPAFAPLK